MQEHKWYVIHTYSGHENKVKANLEKIIENRNLHDFISQIEVPLQEVVEVKNGQKKTVMRKVFPGYVLVKMIMNDDMWSVVRNTRGVTSFVGPGSKPSPLTDSEVRVMGVNVVEKIDLELGDSVKIISGPFENSIGVVSEINQAKHSVIVNLSVFGRETPVELDFYQIQKF
jgi:transcription termination/antitermination factor NusG